MILINCSAREFVKATINKKIFCFGAGEYLRTFLAHCDVLDRIAYIIENDKTKQNTSVNLNGNCIEIISLEKAIQLTNNKTVFVITVGYEYGLDIYYQLENIDVLQRNIVYWALFIVSCVATRLEMHKYRKINFKKTNQMIIPKQIHYCWFGNTPIPQEFQNYIASWEKYCPDYEIVRWDERNYDVNQNEYMARAYKEKAWGFVTDYVRKDVIYKYGGIYFDTDVEILRNIDDLLYQDGFCGKEGKCVASGLGFGARKGLSIIGEWRDVYNEIEFSERTIKDMIACPIHETKILKKHGYKENNELQEIGGLTIYPSEVLSGTISCTGETFVTPNTYTVHHYSASWTGNTYHEKRDAVRCLYFKASNMKTEIMMK